MVDPFYAEQKQRDAWFDVNISRHMHAKRALFVSMCAVYPRAFFASNVNLYIVVKEKFNSNYLCKSNEM